MGRPGLIAPIAKATLPPKTQVWDLWKVEGSRKAKKNWPSENKILQNGDRGGQGSDEERGSQFLKIQESKHSPSLPLSRCSNIATVNIESVSKPSLNLQSYDLSKLLQLEGKFLSVL
ncbi:unnamed protein product [Citrullus colocynthis]|uniref:Uncharacterized protein n=1 Tax=Citrullus colocynthis TaxID=252529 RepID=A0ABP0YNF0_9ROSI